MSFLPLKKNSLLVVALLKKILRFLANYILNACVSLIDENGKITTICKLCFRTVLTFLGHVNVFYSLGQIFAHPRPV